MFNFYSLFILLFFQNGNFHLLSGSFHLELLEVELDLVSAWRHDLPDAVDAVRVAARVVG